MNDTKAWYRSRTLWVNLFFLLAAALVDTQPVLALLQGVLPAKVYMWIAFALPIVNGVLRTITSRGLVK
jgi:hypothetical protein